MSPLRVFMTDQILSSFNALGTESDSEVERVLISLTSCLMVAVGGDILHIRVGTMGDDLVSEGAGDADAQENGRDTEWRAQGTMNGRATGVSMGGWSEIQPGGTHRWN